MEGTAAFVLRERERGNQLLCACSLILCISYRSITVVILEIEFSINDSTVKL